MTLGALGQQLRSSAASKTHGGEVLSPPFVQGSSKQMETTPEDGDAAKKSSPQFSGFLPGFSQSFGSRVSSPVSKRG